MNIVFIVLLVALTGVTVALIVTGIISSQKITKKQLVLLEDVLPEQGGEIGRTIPVRMCLTFSGFPFQVHYHKEWESKYLCKEGVRNAL